MTTITIDIADSKAKDLSKYAQEMGGHVVMQKKELTDIEVEEDEVTHGSYFGENIKRALNILRKP